MMFSSIRSRFIAGFMTLGIAPVLLIALLVGKVSYFSHLDSALHHQQEVAKGVGERLAGQLKQLHANLRVLDDYFGLASQPRERQRELLRILLGDSRQFAELTLFDDNGQELLHLSSYRIISEETLVNRRDEELFRIPHRLLQDYAGVIEFDIETGEPGIEIAIPLIDLKSGQSNGVLSATVQLYGMWDLIREVNRTPDEDIYVLDENGRLIAHRNPSLVLRSKEFKPKFEAHRPQPSLTGGSAIIGMYPIQFGSQQLSLVAEVTEASALAPAYDSIRTILVVMLLSLLLATVLIWLGIQHIIHPIESLSSTVRAIRDGDLNRRIEVQMDDEIGELSDTINQMAATLVSNMHSLAESEERYRLLIEHQNDLVVKFDQHGHLLFVSPSFCNTFGKSSDELLGSRFIPRVHEDDRSGVAASLARLSQPPYTSRHEERALTVAGWRWFSWSARAVLGAQGRVQQVISVGRDITEQKQAEQQLRESEERIRLLLDSTGDGIFGVDREGCCTFINAAALRLLGYESNAEMIGQRMHDLIHYQRADGALLSWKTCPVCTTIESASASHSDNDLLWRRDGSSFPAELHAHPLRHDAQVVGAVVTFSDISERQVLLERLRQAAIVVENTSEGIIITDDQVRIVAVNPAFHEITGYSEQEAVGHKPSLLKSDRHDSRFYQNIWQSLIETDNWQGELWNRRKDGEVFPEWLNISAVRDKQGRVTNYVGIFSDISVIKQSHAKLEYLAHHDPLTGLPNRLLFNARLDHSMQIAKRESHRIATLFLDLDGFKNVNDSLGHPVGDKLLQQVADRLSGVVREEDTVARLGGDEFTIIAEQIDEPSDAVTLAEKVLNIFREPFIIDGHDLYLSTSIGIALYPEDAADVDSLVRNADSAMYHAKRNGRNGYQFYTRALTVTAYERINLESKLRRALERDELLLHYQPQIDLRSGRILGAEALLRWYQPELGLVTPDSFIPLLEESGLIIQVGAWVLEQACRQAVAWQEEGLQLDTIAVNLSSLQIQRTDLKSTVQEVLQSSGLPAHQLELEVTESYVMNEIETSIAALEELHQLGIQLAVDDFGTGYSSLSYLKKLPIDKLKIDKTFVRDLGYDNQDEAIVKAVINLARGLGLKVVAEGIETEAQRAYLLGQGCEEGQGYLFSRPLDSEAFAKLMHGDREQP